MWCYIRYSERHSRAIEGILIGDLHTKSWGTSAGALGSWFSQVHLNITGSLLLLPVYPAVSPRGAQSVLHKSLSISFSIKISYSEPEDMQDQLHLPPVKINRCFVLLCSPKMCDRLQCMALRNPDFTTDDDSWDNSSAEFEQRFQLGNEITCLSRSASSERYEILDNLHVKFNLSKMRSELKH